MRRFVVVDGWVDRLCVKEGGGKICTFMTDARMDL